MKIRLYFISIEGTANNYFIINKIILFYSYKKITFYKKVRKVISQIQFLKSPGEYTSSLGKTALLSRGSLTVVLKFPFPLKETESSWRNDRLQI